MDVLRRLGAERADERRLQLGVRAMVGAADDVRDLEVEVVDRATRADTSACRRRRSSVVWPKRSAPSASGSPIRCAASRWRTKRSLWRSGPSSQPTPSHSRSATIASAPPSTLRAGSVSSIRSRKRAAVLVGEAPVRDRAQRAAEMQRARRAGREAHADHARTLHRRCDGSHRTPSPVGIVSRTMDATRVHGFTPRFPPSSERGGPLRPPPRVFTSPYRLVLG